MATRRTFLKVLGSAAGAFAASPLLEAFADPATASNEFFIFIHQSGGWDVTLWSDPRFEQSDLVDPATLDVIDNAGGRVHHWTDKTLADGRVGFAPITKGNLTFGPAIGNLVDHADRILLVNGISMNTVSHPDGVYFSSTGRHLAGGRPVAASIDTMIANELGKEQLFPTVSVNFPSTFLGPNLDSRVAPLRVGSISTVGKALTRANTYEDQVDRDALTAILTAEADELAAKSFDPAILHAQSLQYGSLKNMIAGNLLEIFTTQKLAAEQPAFFPDQKNPATKLNFQLGGVVNAAFAIEAMKRNIVRCVSFQMASCDTHNQNYKDHPVILQETFDMIATLIQQLDATPHPTLTGDKLSDHTHILVISDFCRTPKINAAGGRDHQPNNTAMIISPKFKANMAYGKSTEDLLPDPASPTITPADVLATFVGAFGGDPRTYMRDGQVIKDVLK